MSHWPGSAIPTQTPRASPPFPHPIWGMGTASNTDRLAVLQLLLRSEAERLTVWATPRDVLDADNRIHLSQTTDQHWASHLRTAWDVDHRLALCMLERYPATPAVRHQLEALVLQNADDPALQVAAACKHLHTANACSVCAPALNNAQHRDSPTCRCCWVQTAFCSRCCSPWRALEMLRKPCQV